MMIFLLALPLAKEMTHPFPSEEGNWCCDSWDDGDEFGDTFEVWSFAEAREPDHLVPKKHIRTLMPK